MYILLPSLRYLLIISWVAKIASAQDMHSLSVGWLIGRLPWTEAPVYQGSGIRVPLKWLSWEWCSCSYSEHQEVPCLRLCRMVIPCLRHAGTCSAFTTEFRTPVSQTVTVYLPYFKCSAVMSSGPANFFSCFTSPSRAGFVSTCDFASRQMWWVHASKSPMDRRQ